MKKLVNIISILVLVVFAGGCKKFLDEKPLTQVPTENYFKSLKDVTAGMAGMYGSFQQEMTGDGNGFSGKYHYWGEGRSDNFDRSQYNNTTITEEALNQMTSGNSVADWTGLYRTIGRANTCIKYIPQAAAFDNAVTTNVVNNNLAQAYAMRAMCYFYIVRLWGDAPLWTEPYLDITQQASKPRNPKAEILDTIVSDLTKAYNMIQKKQTAVIWNINEGTIAAMLADVYLWKKDYPKAITWTANVFTSKGSKAVDYGSTGTTLEPAATWKNLFINPANTNEAMWSISWDYNFNGCACLPISMGLSNNPVAMDSVLHTNWKKNTADIRVKFSYDTLPGLGHWDKVIKFHNIAGNVIPTGTGAALANTYNVYLTMYRLADVYLNYAEALNRSGDPVNSLRYLNYIRVRAGLPALLATDPSISTQDKMEDVILNERRYEFFAEGKRWFDLVRTGKVKEVMDPILKIRQTKYGSAPDGFGSDLNKILFPLHRNVLEYNKKLVQNPSYN
ncbi:RagB/SusD family nutrient uptake outer membrane protein [Sediminibacterium ginsengisoli]|uniref:Starch-binding associating with outer membrane n=1 Tax=Sediminibacterium ginsengisoli TaxID=413434 RepID=A0A1T4KV81_9BACT|nr:RagB/SusD family nutrient uptake outer membrane protein [Sediminibacterium ginsengisoli]SJZ46345.1 Starch-binding associating with outer membrane [Sediminibacterium ginsengisoli]